MRCVRCGFDNRADVRFCEECGGKLDLACAACRASMPPGRKFCGHCGHPVGAAAPAGLGAGGHRLPPPHLAEKILAARRAVQGERKPVTVLFADVRGSVDLLADGEPAETRALLDPILQQLTEAVHRYEGTVNQLEGDGLMALFGAPIAHEDHAVRACYAALAMQDAMRRLSESLRRTHGVEVQARVGLNSGEVVVREIGSDLRMDYTAVGHATRLAASMEQLAAPGAIRLTADTFRLAEGFVEAAPLGPVPVKGLPELVEVFELTGPAPTRTRMQAVAARGLSRFVGRQAELAALAGALDRAGRGTGQVLALVGEPGVGKSRLVWEFTHSHRTQGWRVLESGSVSYGRATAYRPVIDLLRGYFQISDQDDGRKIREKVTGRLFTLDRSLEPVLPALLALLDVPVPESDWRALDPAQRRQRTLDGVCRLLLRESHVQPLLVVFEDLHWIDGETQAVLDGLVRRLSEARLLLVVNYRPEYQHTWTGRSGYSELRVDPLGPAPLHELLDALLGPDPGLAPLRELLVNRTEGIPFFLEEIVRTLVETGALHGERGRYHLRAELHAIQVPSTVQAVLAARVDRLPPEEKRLLQTAAVVGKDVPLPLLRAIVDWPEEGLRRGLTHLQQAEFLYESSLFPELEYTFRHALTHEVTYASVAPERRVATHARVVEALERLYADRLGEQVERLGHHALRGAVWDKSIRYLRQAAAKAFSRSANRAAVEALDRALTVLPHVADPRTRREQAIDLRIDLRGPLGALGDFPRMIALLHEAVALARAADDPYRLAAALGQLASVFGFTGDYDRALDYAPKALAVAETSGNLAARIAATYAMGVVCSRRGDLRRAMQYHRQTVQAVTGDLVAERFGQGVLPAVLARAELGVAHAQLGDFAAAMPSAEEAVRIADSVGHPSSRIMACWGLGLVCLTRGELEASIRPFERGMGICRATDIRFWLPIAATNLGYAYALAGRLDEAWPLLDEALHVAREIDLRLGRSVLIGHLAEASLLAGRAAEALEHGAAALALTREHGERGREAWTLRLIGEIHTRHPAADLEAAERALGEALALSQALGLRPLAARCHLGLGELHQRRARPDPAREELARAAALLREMGMTRWLARAESALAG
jgi:class 3 adenylate cyclase/tetratricopeptide (TPR) repeat protein